MVSPYLISFPSLRHCWTHNFLSVRFLNLIPGLHQHGVIGPNDAPCSDTGKSLLSYTWKRAGAHLPHLLIKDKTVDVPMPDCFQG